MAFALITGASKGIGRAISVELAKRKFDLILVARSQNLLQQLATELTQQYKVTVKYLAIDLSSEDAGSQILSFIEKENIALGILVNNAGYGLWGKFEKLGLKEQINMLRLNNETLVSLTHSLLPLLQKQNQSYILNVASTTAYQAIPFLSVYSASKAFVVAFSRGLAGELKDTGTSVTCLSPGSTTTDFMLVAGMNTPKLINSANKVSMEPGEVATQAVKALFESQVEFIPGLINKITAYANNFLPKKLVEGIAANIYRPL